MKPLYFKQWGIQRSGTNATKAFLELNWPEYPVFMSVFGGKHRPYQSPREWLKYNTLHTFGYVTNYKECQKKMRYPDGYLELISNWEQWNVVSIRNPWHWIESWARKSCNAITDKWIKQEFRRYVSLYTNWFKQNNVICIPQEAIPTNYALLCTHIQRKVGISKPQPLTLPLRPVNEMSIGEDNTGSRYTTMSYCFHNRINVLSYRQMKIIEEECEPVLKIAQPFFDLDIFNQYYTLPEGA